MKTYIKLAALLLALVALMHLLRVIFKTEVIVDGTVIPIWVSIVGFIIPGVLSYGLCKEAGGINSEG